MRGGGGSNGASGRAAGGAAGGQGGGAAGDPPPPPDPPPSDHGGPGGCRMSRRQRAIKELEFAKPIIIREPKRFEGKPADDFDTWLVLVEVYT